VLDNIAAVLTAASSTVSMRVSVRGVYITDIHAWAGAARPALCAVPKIKGEFAMRRRQFFCGQVV
jgi:hypothetical protein